VEETLRDLVSAAQRFDASGVRRELGRIVPEFIFDASRHVAKPFVFPPPDYSR